MTTPFLFYVYRSWNISLSFRRSRASGTGRLATIRSTTGDMIVITVSNEGMTLSIRVMSAEVDNTQSLTLTSGNVWIELVCTTGQFSVSILFCFSTNRCSGVLPVGGSSRVS